MKIVIRECSYGLSPAALAMRKALVDAIMDGDVFEYGIGEPIGLDELDPIVDVYDGDVLVRRFCDVQAHHSELLVHGVRSGNYSSLEDRTMLADVVA